MATRYGFMDFTEMMKLFDPANMSEELSKLTMNCSMSGIDVDTIVASQRKNVEALTIANRVAFEGLMAVAKREAEIFQEAMTEVQRALDEISESETPLDATAKQAEITKLAFEKALVNMRELVEMVAASNDDATATINARISESLNEIKALAVELSNGKLPNTQAGTDCERRTELRYRKDP